MDVALIFDCDLSNVSLVVLLFLDVVVWMILDKGKYSTTKLTVCWKQTFSVKIMECEA